jgi:hypothetical protein
VVPHVHRRRARPHGHGRCPPFCHWTFRSATETSRSPRSRPCRSLAGALASGSRTPPGVTQLPLDAWAGRPAEPPTGWGTVRFRAGRTGGGASTANPLICTGDRAPSRATPPPAPPPRPHYRDGGGGGG